MIVQQGKRFNLNSRSEINIFDKDNFLPIITAPMFSVVDTLNYVEFVKRGIQVCMPRRNALRVKGPGKWESYSLSNFEKYYCNENIKFNEIHRVCIDVANGNMRTLHQAIYKCKHLHGNKVIIMSGNVATLEAYLELASMGCDFIRVGIGGSSVCNTYTQTGVGQEDLEDLISEIAETKHNIFDLPFQYLSIEKQKNIFNSKIVADGISRQMLKLINKGACLDNGYALINRLLFSGADLVMIGRLFAQSLESAGTKRIKGVKDDGEEILEVDYYGMSTKRAQKKYSKRTNKASEGNSKWLLVKWTLDQWLNGDENRLDYLPGFKKALASSMSYNGAMNLNNFTFLK